MPDTHVLRTSLLVVALQALAMTAAAGPAEVVDSAASGASSVVKKVEHAVRRGADAASSGLHRAASAAEHGASVAGGAIQRTAHRLGLPAASAPPASAQKE